MHGEFLSSSDFHQLGQVMEVCSKATLSFTPCKTYTRDEVENCENICMFVPELIPLENGGRIIVSMMSCFIGYYICICGALTSLEFFVHFVFKLW